MRPSLLILSFWTWPNYYKRKGIVDTLLFSLINHKRSLTKRRAHHPGLGYDGLGKIITLAAALHSLPQTSKMLLLAVSLKLSPMF